MKFIYQSIGRSGYIEADNLDSAARKWGVEFLHPEITCHADLVKKIETDGDFLTIDHGDKRLVRID